MDDAITNMHLRDAQKYDTIKQRQKLDYNQNNKERERENVQRKMMEYIDEQVALKIQNKPNK